MEVLIDASVWIAHLHRPEDHLAHLLARDVVLVHEAVLGELALGPIPNRGAFLTDLSSLRRIPPASTAETWHLVEVQRLWSKGLGWVDALVLASAMIARVELWTRDRALRSVADQLGVAHRS